MGASSYAEALRAGAGVYAVLKSRLAAAGHCTGPRPAAARHRPAEIAAAVAEVIRSGVAEVDLVEG